MAVDEPIAPAPLPDAAVTAPVVAAPEPAAPAAPSPEPAAPVVADAKPVEGDVKPADDGAVKPHTDEPTLLETVTDKPADKTDAKPADEKTGEKPPETKPVEVKPEDAKPGDKPAEVVVEAKPLVYEFKLPETIKANPEKMGAYTGILQKHNIAPEVGQELIDLHANAMQRFAEQTLDNQHRTFADTRKGWRTQAMADEEIGGAGHETAMGAVARMRDLLIPQTDRNAFDYFLRITVAGDHPMFLKMIHRASRFFDEPLLPPPGAKPSPSNGQRPGRRGLRDIYKATAEGQSR